MTLPKTTAELRALDAAHHLHPFSDMKSLNAEGSRIVVKAEGVWLTDSDGNRILDGMSGLWCVNVGYGREEIVEAVAAQLRELPYYNTFFKTTHRPAIELSAKLAELTPPQFNKVFFTGSGSESNDTVIKLVRRYFQIKEKPEKKIIISRRNAYHGSTVAAGSLGGMAPMHGQSAVIPDILHIAQPYFWGEARQGETPEEFGLRTARALEASAGRRRRHHSARQLLAGNRPHLPRARHPVRVRRSDLRLRPHGQLVRLRDLRHRAGHSGHGQGHHLGLHAAGRRHGGGPGGGSAA